MTLKVELMSSLGSFSLNLLAQSIFQKSHFDSNSFVLTVVQS